MIEKSQRWLAKYVGYKNAYRIVFITYATLVTIPLLVLGYIFSCMQFVVVGSVIINLIRSVSYGYHHNSNLYCTILTYTLLMIFGYISKTIPLEWSFLCAIISSRYIYINAPLELTHKDKSKQWHRNKIQLMIIVCLICSLIALCFKYNHMASDILWSLSVVAMTLFKNVDEE